MLVVRNSGLSRGRPLWDLVRPAQRLSPRMRPRLAKDPHIHCFVVLAVIVNSAKAESTVPRASCENTIKSGSLATAQGAMLERVLPFLESRVTQ